MEISDLLALIYFFRFACYMWLFPNFFSCFLNLCNFMVLYFFLCFAFKNGMDRNIRQFSRKSWYNMYLESHCNYKLEIMK